MDINKTKLHYNSWVLTSGLCLIPGGGGRREESGVFCCRGHTAYLSEQLLEISMSWKGPSDTLALGDTPTCGFELTCCRLSVRQSGLGSGGGGQRDREAPFLPRSRSPPAMCTAPLPKRGPSLPLAQWPPTPGRSSHLVPSVSLRPPVPPPHPQLASASRSRMYPAAGGLRGVGWPGGRQSSEWIQAVVSETIRHIFLKLHAAWKST